ncbi:MAG: hypothetical protein V3W34_03010 [Phycisphaerae bacterium]
MSPKTRFSDLPAASVAWVCLALSVACPLPADEIVHGAVSLQRIRIVDLEGGRIVYRAPAGELRYVSITEVDHLYVDSVSALRDLNQAESRLASGDYLHAVGHYERALRVASDFWERLVRARLIQACDGADRIDMLVRQFVLLVRDETAGPMLAAQLLPVAAPSPQARRVEQALRAINDVINEVPSQSARIVLEMLRFHIARRGQANNPLELARQLVPQPIPATVATRGVFRVKCQALRMLLEAGEAGQVLRRINEDLADVPATVLPELLLVKAEALLQSAADDATATRAGWAAMRVVIHYPDDVLVPDALLLAAGVQERAGRVPTALRLLDECVNHERATPAAAKTATDRAERLRSAG